MNFGSSSSFSVLLYFWRRVVVTWITSFPLSFQCVLISLFAVSIFQSGTMYFLIWSVCMQLPFVLFVPFSLFVSFERFSAFIPLSFSFSVSSLFSLFFYLHHFFLSSFVKRFSNFGLPISLLLLPLFTFEEVDCYVASICLQTCNNWCKPSWLPIQNSEPSCQSYKNFERFLFAATFLSVLLKLLKLADCLKYSVSKFWIYRVFIG